MQKVLGFKLLSALLDAFLLTATVGALTLTFWLYVRNGFTTLEGIPDSSMSVHRDYDIFWRSARAWLDGGDAYRDTGAPDFSNNPPLWTLLFSPLALLEPLTGYRLWVLIMALAQIVALVWAADELRLRAGVAVAAAGALLASESLLGTFRIGQMYPVLTLGLVAAWVWDRRYRPVASGCALGVVVAIKPSLAPLLLWPLVRRRWRSFGVASATVVATTIVGAVSVGLDSTRTYLEMLGSRGLNGVWDNVSLPGAAARVLRENEFSEPIATVSWAPTAALILGIMLILISAALARHDPDLGFWALVAASLLASPITWWYYLLVLAPSVLLLLARGQRVPALLLAALVLIPQSWVQLWQGSDAAVATLALAIHTYILLAYWLTFIVPALAADGAGYAADKPN